MGLIKWTKRVGLFLESSTAQAWEEPRYGAQIMKAVALFLVDWYMAWFSVSLKV